MGITLVENGHHVHPDKGVHVFRAALHLGAFPRPLYPVRVEVGHFGQPFPFGFLAVLFLQSSIGRYIWDCRIAHVPVGSGKGPWAKGI